MNKKIVVAITGASGTIYALRLIDVLIEKGSEVYVIFSKAAIETMKHEISEDRIIRTLTKVSAILENDDISCFLASGSFIFHAMIIVPCSINTVGSIHSNLANNLISRCALIAQKEKRQLVIVPREMPLSTQTLKQLYELSSFGISICVPSPGFYSKPQCLDDIVDFVVGKILNLLNIRNDLLHEWNGLEK